MKKSEKFLSIGKLSEMTGVHVKSLRYYGEIGILRPAYVDPETGYRYYTQRQTVLVDAIRLCVELDVPLREFQRFFSESSQRIYYTGLLDYGTKLAREKIRSIQKRLEDLETMRREIHRSGQLQASGRVMKFALPEKRCWAVPFEGKQNGEPFYNALNRLYPVIHQAGWGIGYEYGLFCQWGKNGRDQFLYVELLGGSGAPSPAITRIPAGEYFCVKTGQSDMENAPEYFPELFAADYERTLVEVELYVGDYDLQNPDFELRCSAPSGGF